MRQVVRAVTALPWWVLVVAALTLGLAPFRPEPHLVEKTRMLLGGDLVAAVDWFDLALHGTPWVLLALRAVVAVVGRPDTDRDPTTAG